MPRSRPQLSITLPRNFTFHYTDGEPPKTPEREVPAPAPRSPNAEGAYRVRRRSRAAASSVFQNATRDLPSFSDIPLPTIETPPPHDLSRPSQALFAVGYSENYLVPITRKNSSLPRTPIARKPHLAGDWKTQKDIGESITRPMSACSLMSDSSDASNESLTSYPAGDGSCTSPESDAPDPFQSKFASIKRGKSKQWAAFAQNEMDFNPPTTATATTTAKQPHIKWTPDMDKHLWSTYVQYLQDPTVTPFKMLPGTAPPLGVCHRVAREARRSWRGGRAGSRKPSGLLSPFAAQQRKDHTNQTSSVASDANSPDTITATRSGSNTPTDSSISRNPAWPKSGSSTRQRLRYLCKKKPNIAPHYQRLMQNRSPSPFSSSSRIQSRATSRLSEMTNSSPYVPSTSSFSTRDVQLSLTTSTAASMQPDGPLAQLAAGDQLPTSQQTTNQDWFNEPPVPFASGPPIPSDVISGTSTDDLQMTEASETPRLGSPLGFHTWGPSRSKQRSRPSASRLYSNEEMSSSSSLRSPLRLHDTFPYPGVQKRRAINSLEDELSPGGSTMQESLLNNLFGSPPEGRHRRVRSRGFSLGDVHTTNPLEALFMPPSPTPNTATETGLDIPSSDGPAPSTPTAQIRRLGSPFQGISPRPTRLRGPSRHMATTSLGSYDASAFSSIGETLGQASSTQPFDRQ